MKTLYLDCGMGAAGDMLTAALLELLPDPDAFLAELNALGIPSVTYAAHKAEKCGIVGTQVTVTIDGMEESASPDAHEHVHSHEHGHAHDDGHSHEHAHEEAQTHPHAHNHSHRGMREIEAILRALPVSEKVRSDIQAVYTRIAQAESQAHGVPVSEIHFHEVGTMDAIADVTAVCLLMERLGAAQVITSPVHVGSGHVRCAHGILPVPAPATASILRGVPIFGGGIKGELCTPTGAALLRHFTTRFGEMPVLRTEAIGYGMGKKDFSAANCVRALLGEAEDTGDWIVELSCNLDDMTAEAIGFAQEQLLSAGALDVFCTPIQMKKSRPGVMLTVLCDTEQKETMCSLLFCHTTTLGVRETRKRRYTLKRSIRTLSTRYGEVRRKRAEGYGVTREKIEYEDLARIARAQNLSLAEVAARLAQEERA